MNKRNLKKVLGLSLAAAALTSVAPAQQNIVLNELYRSNTGLTAAGSEFIEVVIINDIGPAVLDQYQIGDATNDKSIKGTAYALQNTSQLLNGTVLNYFPRGTIIVIAGSGIVAEDLSYDPPNGDWNIIINLGNATYLTPITVSTLNGANDINQADVIWVDNETDAAFSNTNVSPSGFGVSYGNAPGGATTLETASTVTQISTPGNGQNIGNTANVDGASLTANWDLNIGETPGNCNTDANIVGNTENCIAITQLQDPTTLSAEISEVTTEFLSNGDVLIVWTTSEEINNAGFNVFLGKDDINGVPYAAEQLNSSLIPSENPNGNGATYSFTVPSAAVDAIDEPTFFIQDVEFSGKRGHYGPLDAGSKTTSVKDWLIFN